ncbi:MAG: protein kinase domain-containing protein [Kofleriaceae bacterium]
MKKPAPFGKYYLLERINVGGMAEVFRAKAFGVEGFERLVAVKRILPNIAEDKEFIRMFIEEAKLAVQLNHANIAQIFDLGVVDGSYYIALEHVHGRDLRGIFDRCRAAGEAMPVAQACFVVMKVCEGLDYAHNKRDQAGRELSLVHRDVSPQNVLVSFEGEVKLIDFGIAKAAGKGSKTQAGILKGKFGYMSPEQVRGLPIDRRSDVFSCGIVLYELLTGERLFVGESDFSTLEKVRNVEILPPSTYNRKIPDELERIVLKALAKDTEDRYQNAIDLHDELQAFVYTAGEFYSRKDLAGWMKKTFGKEIEDETAKLESYRQLKPPPAEAPAPVSAAPRTNTGPRATAAMASAVPPPAPHGSPAKRSTGQMNAVGTKPPPPPDRRSGEMPRLNAKADREDSGLAWDDDELETQIYDNPEDDPKNQVANQVANRAAGALGKQSSKPLPLVAAPTPDPGHPAMTMRGVPAAPSLAGATASTSATVNGGSPDLSSLVSTAKGWEGGPPPSMSPSPAATMNGMGLGGNGTPNFATGSHKTPVPLPPTGAQQPLFESVRESAPIARASHSDVFDPMATFGSSVARRGDKKKTAMLLAIGGAVVAAVVVVIIIAMSGKKDSTQTATNTPPMETTTTGVSPTPPRPTTQVGDQNTGFDLYVTPRDVSSWRLDGEARTDRLPSRIRGIAPGTHTVQIDPPPGFMSENQQVIVEEGKAPKVSINLSPIQGIHGVFESNPPGAKVSLIVNGVRQDLGPSPQKAPLDPRMTYQVLFEKPGYVSVNKPIVFSGQLEEKYNVPLEKAAGGMVAIVPEVKTPEVKQTPEVKKTPEVKTDKTGPVTKIDKKPDVKPEVKPEIKDPVEDKVGNDTKVVAKAMGTLMLGSKPSCDIYIDGTNTGKQTPQRDLKLTVGKHRITLMNNEFGIRETFSVEIKADAPTKEIKDYSDRLPK